MYAATAATHTTPILRFCKNRAMIIGAIRSVLAFLRFANTRVPTHTHTRARTGEIRVAVAVV